MGWNKSSNYLIKTYLKFYFSDSCNRLNKRKLIHKDYLYLNDNNKENFSKLSIKDSDIEWINYEIKR